MQMIIQKLRLVCVALLALFFGLTGCEGDAFTKVVDVDLEDPDPLPVLYANWSTTDTVLYAFVTRSVGVLDEDPIESYNGLELTLLIDEVVVGTFTEAEDAQFFDNFAPRPPVLPINSVYRLARPDQLQPGARVELRVEGLPDGATMRASGQFPEVTPFDVVDISASRFDTTVFSDGSVQITQRDGELTFKVPDPAATRDYYQFYVLGIALDSASGGTFEQLEELYGRDEDTRFQPVYRANVFRDIVDNGSTISVTFDFYEPFGPGFPSGISVVNYAVYEKIAPATYTYLRERDALELAEDNPFAEPLILGSNVEGGLGHLLLRSRSERFSL